MSREDKIKYFGEGEWVDEKDFLFFEHNGVNCCIVRIVMKNESEIVFGGYLCGYCELPKNHPWLRKIDTYFDISTQVHGGITYFEGNEEKGCVVGFDCSHSGDLVPFLELVMNKDETGVFTKFKENRDMLNKIGRMPTYKNWEFVMDHCKILADEIIKSMEGT